MPAKPFKIASVIVVSLVGLVVSLVVSLGAAACNPYAAEIQEAQIRSARVQTQAQKDMCNRVFDLFYAMNCADEAQQAKSAEEARLRPGETAKGRLRPMLDVQCVAGPVDQARSQKVNTCLDDLDAKIAVATAEREKRLVVERARIPALNADGRFLPMRDRVRQLERAMRLANENLRLAQLNHHRTATIFEEDAAAATRDYESAVTALSALLASHGIEARDAKDLNLL